MDKWNYSQCGTINREKEHQQQKIESMGPRRGREAVRAEGRRGEGRANAQQQQKHFPFAVQLVAQSIHSARRIGWVGDREWRLEYIDE